MTADRVRIVAPDPAWPERFAVLRDRLSAALGPLALEVAHIGSTAVPGLASKDRIDVQVGVASLDPEPWAQLVAAFVGAGFAAPRRAADHVPAGDVREAAQWEKGFVRGDHPALGFASNVHIRVVGRANHAYALRFRDLLRARPDLAASYEAAKRQLAAQVAPEAYADVKDPVCDLVLANAPPLGHLVGALGLLPHPEGGFYRETFRSPRTVETARGPRAAVTSILFLLPAGAFSGWHRVHDADEIWCFHQGAAVALWTLGADGPRRTVLSPAHPQHVVPADTWQAAEAVGGDVLCGCQVAPGFDFADFELASDAGFAGPFAEEVARLIRRT